MNVQYSLIHELMVYKFILGYDATAVTKNISCTKVKSYLDHNILTK